MVETYEKTESPLHVFDTLESEVRSYIRSFPAVFEKARGSKVWDRNGKEYIDFFSGAGALNYGHNDPQMKAKLIEYLTNDGIVHSLDMATAAKEKFLSRFQAVILKPRKMDYKMMFPGPTGTNTVESALKLARKVTGRTNVVSFTNAFHGMTLGALAVTGNESKRQGAGVPLTNTTFMPYDNYFKDGSDTSVFLKKYFEDTGSGLDLPAAVILETTQGEGGINSASFEWIKKIEQICRQFDVLFIVDDIQAGCGRSGTFFSFEPAGVSPDMICLSKSISGSGLPMAVTLIKPEHDVFHPGEHNGTFRGNNPAFVTATEALTYWEDDKLEKAVQEKSQTISTFLQSKVEQYPQLFSEARGRGFMQGLVCVPDGLASQICASAFERGLIMETSGPKDEVAKLFPALNIDQESLEQGLRILGESIDAVASQA